MNTFSLSIFYLMFVSTASIAQVDLNRSSLEADIIDSYESLLATKVTGGLLKNYDNYIAFPNEYWNFLNETFLDNWDFDSTTRALIGDEVFSSISDRQFRKLSTTLEVTLIRYAFESLSHYGEQQLNVIDIKMNEKKTFAWLKINMESPTFPNIHLDLLLKRNSDQKWRGVDFRFKGITYVNLKKNSYRQDYQEFKFEGLLKNLDDKNRVFFRGLCMSEMKYTDPNQPPCL